MDVIVSIGAGSSVTGSRSSAINRFLGDVFVAVCVFVASILLAYATYRLYDLPVRERLKMRLQRYKYFSTLSLPQAKSCYGARLKQEKIELFRCLFKRRKGLNQNS